MSTAGPARSPNSKAFCRRNKAGGLDDLDTHRKKAVAAGGKIHVEEQEVPGMGSFSLFTDPVSPDGIVESSPETVMGSRSPEIGNHRPVPEKLVGAVHRRTQGADKTSGTVTLDNVLSAGIFN